MHYCAFWKTIVITLIRVKQYSAYMVFPLGAMQTSRSPDSGRSDAGPALAADEAGEAKNPFLVALGERVRELRARRGLTRKAVAQMSEVSERHLANLEYGIGNASILVLQQVAGALQCSLAELIGDMTTASPEWLMLRELLEHRSEADLRRAREALVRLFDGAAAAPTQRSRCIALIGLRGAGKSTLGQMLADALGCPFIELSRQIEAFATAAPAPERPVLDWCGGKGHLGRLLALHWRTPVTTLEIDPALCAAGEALAERQALDHEFLVADALTAEIPAGRHAVALHACGELHRRLIEGAADAGLAGLDVAPCCYHRGIADAYRPLSGPLPRVANTRA